MEHLDPDRRAAVQSTSPLDLSPVVLIADDERALLELLGQALRADLFRVLTAADGQHALALSAPWRTSRPSTGPSRPS
jgi:hypothetical protein